jgi:Skp family chaperone for outer membrane proteins
MVEGLKPKMKNTMGVALLAVTAATGLFAQPGPGGRGDRTPPTAAEMVERRVEMLTARLTLDAAQQAQAKTIFSDENTAAAALRTKIEAAQDVLQDAVKGSASESQIDQLAATVGTLHGQMLATHAKAQAKFRAILNATQKEKLDTMRGGMGGGMGAGMGGGRMRPMRGRGPQ